MRKSKSKLTNEEVKAMLEQLSEHFGEPVRPVSDYCNALLTWSKVVCKKFPAEQRAHSSIHLSIRKSNLLARLIYGGEKLRTRECPLHKGEWTGQAMLMGCPHKCDGTGWLREPEDENVTEGVDG